MKVLTFSRQYPGYHPRKGEPTDFVSKIWNGLEKTQDLFRYTEAYYRLNPWSSIEATRLAALNPKWHTIRGGNRWKAGDWFSPRIWSDRPYNSKQIEIAPAIEIKKIWEFEIYGMTILLNNRPVNCLELEAIAKNDGLAYNDFKSWFNKVPFLGQVICWNENIEY